MQIYNKKGKNKLGRTKTTEWEYLNSRNIFGMTNEQTKKRKPRTMIMKNSNNVLITEEKKITEEFREAFIQLFGSPVDTTKESIIYLTLQLSYIFYLLVLQLEGKI